MSIPYDAGAAAYLSRGFHANVKDGGSWRYVDKLSVRSGGSWRTVKQAYVKSGNAWRTFFDQENVFTFSVSTGTGTRTSTFNLGDWLTTSNYTSPTLGRTYNSGDRIRGLITVNGNAGGDPGIYIGAFPSGSAVYIRVNSGARVAGKGGNGGSVGGSGQTGGTALYTRTGVWVENNGQVWGGGGGGRGGNNGQCVGTYYYNYNCGKNCYRQGSGNNYNSAQGGGGGGGGGIPAGNAGNRAAAGSYNSGGNGGGGSGCGSNGGARGGDPGAAGSGGNRGTNGDAGYYVDGNSYIYSWITTGDRRGRTVN